MDSDQPATKTVTTTQTYEVRTHDNPTALPLGTSTVSRHRSLEAAESAIAREQRRFSKSYGALHPGSYIVRIIVEIDNGVERRVA